MIWTYDLQLSVWKAQDFYRFALNILRVTIK